LLIGGMGGPELGQQIKKLSFLGGWQF